MIHDTLILEIQYAELFNCNVVYASRIPVSIEEVLLNDIVVFLRFVLERVLVPGHLVSSTGEKHDPYLGVIVILLSPPSLSYSRSPFEMIYGRMNIADQKDVSALLIATSRPTFDGPSKRMRIDDRPLSIDYNIIVAATVPKIIGQSLIRVVFHFLCLATRTLSVSVECLSSDSTVFTCNYDIDGVLVGVFFVTIFDDVNVITDDVLVTDIRMLLSSALCRHWVDADKPLIVRTIDGYVQVGVDGVIICLVASHLVKLKQLERRHKKYCERTRPQERP